MACLQGPGGTVDWEELVGQRMQLKILELDEEKDRLVLSNRKNNFSSRKLDYNVRAPWPAWAALHSAHQLESCMHTARLYSAWLLCHSYMDSSAGVANTATIRLQG